VSHESQPGGQLERHSRCFFVGHTPQLAEEMERLITSELFDETVELWTVTTHLVYLLAVVVDVHSAYVNITSSVLYVARQHLERGRLSGTIRPQQTKTLVGLKSQIQPPDGFLLSIFLPDVTTKQETITLLKI